jgi:uncharacterized membrane protein (UPF0136 family)
MTPESARCSRFARRSAAGPSSTARTAPLRVGDYSSRLDSINVLVYECASANQRRNIRESMEATKIYFIIFGVLTIAGGIVGYVKAGSIASVIAGSITGVLLLVGAFLLPEHRGAGLATALVISLLLAAQFVPKFLQTGRVMPAGIMSILSVIAVIVAIVAWIKK